MSSRHHSSSRDREFDRRSEYGRRDDRQPRDHQKSHRDADRDRGQSSGRTKSASGGHHSRSRDARASRSPQRREAAGLQTAGTTPSKGGTPGGKGSALLQELLKQAKAKQEQAAGGALSGAGGDGSASEGEVLEAGEIAAQGPDSAVGSKRHRYHSPIVWNLDAKASATTGAAVPDLGDRDSRLPPPPVKRPAPASAVDRAAEELEAFRRQQAATRDFDPDGPPALKRSPSVSGSEDEAPSFGAFGGAEQGGRVSRSAEPGGGASGAGEDSRQEEEEDEDGRPRGASRWHEEEAEARPGSRGRAAGGQAGPSRPSPSSLTSGGEPAWGREGGGGRSSASRSPGAGAAEGPDGRGGTRPPGEDAGGGDGERDPLISPQVAARAECRSVDEFERLNRVSEGTYGVVFRARCKKTGRICALKKIKMEKERDGFPVTSIREINILLNLHHPNIVNVSEVVMGNRLDQIYMVMEFMDHDLKGLMNDKSQMARSFSVAEVKCLMRQLLDGLHYLHDNWVIHRDLKTSNILYNNNGELKICDFGLARQFGSPLRPYTQPVVTLWYRPPELLLGAQQYSTAVDMWSIGCIMAELLTGKPLFDGQGEIEQLDKMCAVLGTPNEDVWPGLRQLPHWGKITLRPQPPALRSRFSSSFGSGATLTEAGLDLLSRLLAYDPAQRITAAEALEHRWFAESPFPQRTELMPTFRSNKDGSGPVRQAAVGAVSPPLGAMPAPQALKAR